MKSKINLEEYERILGEHGHKYIYYPKDVIQHTFRLYVLSEVEKSIKEDRDILSTINKCFRGY